MPLPDCIGLIPAAGRASRLALVDGSKELLPVPDIVTPAQPGSTPAKPGQHEARDDIPVCEYLLRQYENAGINDIALIRRDEKADLGRHFASAAMGSRFHVTDLLTEPTPGSVHSLAVGCAHFPDRTVVMGFPDIILLPPELCASALRGLQHDGVDVCLAAVPFTPDQRRNWDFCEYDTTQKTADSAGRVRRIIVKPEDSSPEGIASDNPVTNRLYGWSLAVWRPVFSRFLIDFLDDPMGAGRFAGEISMSDALQAAIDKGFNVQCVNEPSGYALDIGQPERLKFAREFDSGSLDNLVYSLDPT